MPNGGPRRQRGLDMRASGETMALSLLREMIRRRCTVERTRRTACMACTCPEQIASLRRGSLYVGAVEQTHGIVRV